MYHKSTRPSHVSFQERCIDSCTRAKSSAALRCVHLPPNTFRAKQIPKFKTSPPAGARSLPHPSPKRLRGSQPMNFVAGSTALYDKYQFSPQRRHWARDKPRSIWPGRPYFEFVRKCICIDTDNFFFNHGRDRRPGCGVRTMDRAHTFKPS
jgi:hypothetical protein